MKSATQPNAALQRKLKRSTCADSAVVGALRGFTGLVEENTAASRRNLRTHIEQNGLQLNRRLREAFGDSQDRINLQKLTEFFPLDLEDMQPQINERGVGLFSALFTEEVGGDAPGTSSNEIEPNIHAVSLIHLPLRYPSDISQTSLKLNILTMTRADLDGVPQASAQQRDLRGTSFFCVELVELLIRHAHLGRVAREGQVAPRIGRVGLVLSDDRARWHTLRPPTGTG